MATGNNTRAVKCGRLSKPNMGICVHLTPSRTLLILTTLLSECCVRLPGSVTTPRDHPFPRFGYLPVGYTPKIELEIV